MWLNRMQDMESCWLFSLLPCWKLSRIDSSALFLLTQTKRKWPAVMDQLAFEKFLKTLTLPEQNTLKTIYLLDVNSVQPEYVYDLDNIINGNKRPALGNDALLSASEEEIQEQINKVIALAEQIKVKKEQYKVKEPVFTSCGHESDVNQCMNLLMIMHRK